MEDNSTVSFRTKKRKKAALDAIASIISRDRSFVINEAIDNYIELHEWQLSHIQAGLAQARKGQFASDKEVNSALKKFRL